jgi:hypothetical protein
MLTDLIHQVIKDYTIKDGWEISIMDMYGYGEVRPDTQFMIAVANGDISRTMYLRISGPNTFTISPNYVSGKCVHDINIANPNMISQIYELLDEATS